MGPLLAVAVAAVALVLSNEPADVVVTRDTLALPAGCSVTETAALVTAFLDAFNRGDLDELDGLFAPAGEGREDFKWYSSDDGGGPQAVSERDQLLDYFSDRRRHAETMRLVSLDLGMGRGNAVGIGYALIREADDIPRGVARGKGQIDCASGRFYVWTMAMTMTMPSDTSPTTCPTPTGWRPGAPVLACTRGPNARAVAPGAIVVPSAREAGCRSQAALRRIRSLLSAFNIGNGASFRAGLAAGAAFSPAGRNLATPRAVDDFVGHRYFRLGEGWTLTRLAPLRGNGRFALTITVSRLGAPFGRGDAAVMLDCKSGLVRSWSGPALRLH
jgi:hypothetical protein